MSRINVFGETKRAVSGYGALPIKIVVCFWFESIQDNHGIMAIDSGDNAIAYAKAVLQLCYPLSARRNFPYCTQTNYSGKVAARWTRISQTKRPHSQTDCQPELCGRFP